MIYLGIAKLAIHTDHIKRVVIETIGVCDVTLRLWRDVRSFAIHLTNRSFFFQNALIEYRHQKNVWPFDI